MYVNIYIQTLIYSHIALFINILASNYKMFFKPKCALGTQTINRILQTSLRSQLNKTGNVSNRMFDYIDDNKYMISDNRVPFIRSCSQNSTFEIEHADLPYNNWISELIKKLSKCTVYVPFTVLQDSSLNTPCKRKIEIKEEVTEYDDSAIDIDINILKKRRLDESLSILHKLKENHVLTKNERIDVIKVIRANAFIEHIDELAKVFVVTDGEKRMSMLSVEQRFCLNSILEYAFPSDFKDKYPDVKVLTQNTEYNPFYKLFLIEGSAGCGKSSIIESLNFYTYTQHKECSKLLYITQTNVLCQNMRNKCFYNDGMQYLTFFKFLNILNLNYYDKKQLLLHCDALKEDAFQNTCGSEFLNAMKDIVNLPVSSINDDNYPRLFIIFDEIYTVSNGKLSLFLFVVRCLKIQNPELNIYCILIGDKHQLRPFTKIEDIKLQVVKQYDGVDDDLIKKEIKEEDTNIQSLIAQSESLVNATKFTLTKQYRIFDEKYSGFVEMLRHCQNTELDGIKILEQIEALWPEKINNKLMLKYPIDEILSIIDDIGIKDYKNIIIRMHNNNIFNKIIDTIVFCFTNKHAHYYTHALAFSYHAQLSQSKDTIKVDDYIVFSVIYNFDHLKFIDNRTKIKDLINDRNYLVNILPLIRYCPYKILTSNSPVARLSIVYLIDWSVNDDNRSITHLVVYSPDTNYVFTLMPSRFEMNLFKNCYLFGFPLQFAFSSTFASSQGLTLNSKIAVSCANISKAELYVCLTRIRKSEDLVRIY